MVAILLTTDTFRSNTTVSRWRDPVWLAWLAAPLYWVHQLEEYVSLRWYASSSAQSRRAPSGLSAWLL